MGNTEYIGRTIVHVAARLLTTMSAQLAGVISASALTTHRVPGNKATSPCLPVPLCCPVPTTAPRPCFTCTALLGSATTEPFKLSSGVLASYAWTDAAQNAQQKHARKKGAARKQARSTHKHTVHTTARQRAHSEEVAWHEYVQRHHRQLSGRSLCHRTGHCGRAVSSCAASGTAATSSTAAATSATTCSSAFAATAASSAVREVSSV